MHICIHDYIIQIAKLTFFFFYFLFIAPCYYINVRFIVETACAFHKLY